MALWKFAIKPATYGGEFAQGLLERPFPRAKRTANGIEASGGVYNAADAHTIHFAWCRYSDHIIREYHSDTCGTNSSLFQSLYFR